jgi:GDP-4-dehydro-6-deoxy-D-mannose reductase
MGSLEVRIETDPERMRPSDVPVLLGSAAKFERDTGWKPEIPFERTLSDLLEYWRDRLGKPEVEMP